MRAFLFFLFALSALNHSCVNLKEQPSKQPQANNAKQAKAETETTTETHRLFEITISEEKPKYFGGTGLHLYAVSPDEIDSVKHIRINKQCEAMTLYKVYYDLAIFLSNESEPSPFSQALSTMGVFGNPVHQPSISSSRYVKAEYQIVGYLDQEDVKRYVEFMDHHQLREEDAVAFYYNKLSPDVKAELEQLLGKTVVSELHAYLLEMDAFYKECLDNNNEVLLMVFA